MKVHHILKDGTRVDDITGKVVRMEHCKGVYDLMTELNRNTKRKGKTT